MESPSGRGRTPRKRVRGQPLRGFKSHLHRLGLRSARHACEGFACAVARSVSARTAGNAILPAADGGVRCSRHLACPHQAGRLPRPGRVPGVHPGHGVRHRGGEQVLRLLPDLGRAVQRPVRAGAVDPAPVGGQPEARRFGATADQRHQRRARRPVRRPVQHHRHWSAQPHHEAGVRLPAAAVLRQGVCELQSRPSSCCPAPPGPGHLGQRDERDPDLPEPARGAQGVPGGAS